MAGSFESAGVSAGVATGASICRSLTSDARNTMKLSRVSGSYTQQGGALVDVVAGGDLFGRVRLAPFRAEGAHCKPSAQPAWGTGGRTFLEGDGRGDGVNRVQDALVLDVALGDEGDDAPDVLVRHRARGRSWNTQRAPDAAREFRRCASTAHFVLGRSTQQVQHCNLWYIHRSYA